MSGAGKKGCAAEEEIPVVVRMQDENGGRGTSFDFGKGEKLRFAALPDR